MVIEAVVSAKSLWYIDRRALNPRGRNFYKLLVPSLERMYGFEGPKEFDEQKGVRFEGGEFSPSEKGNDFTGVTLTIYWNGLVAQTTTSTDDADVFLERTLSKLAQDSSIVYKPDLVRKKQFATEVWSRSERPLLLFPQMAEFCRLLSTTAYPAMNPPLFSVSGLIFDTDPGTLDRQIPFRFERRIESRADENLYYSHGPFSNRQHQTLLDALEKALAM